MKQRVASSLAAAVATCAAVLLVGAPASSAQSLAQDYDSCPSGNACTWQNWQPTAPNLSGAKTVWGASWAGTGWHYYNNPSYFQMTKNRFDNRKVWVRTSPLANPLCVRPGENLAGGLSYVAINIKENSAGCP